MAIRRTSFVCAWLALVAVPEVVQAGDRLSVSLTPQTMVGRYGGSELRDSFYSSGLLLGLHYWDRAGVTLGYAHTGVKFVDTSSNIEQENFYGSGYVNLPVDRMRGTMTLRMDGHYIDNDDASGDTDGVRVLAPVVSYLPYSKKFALDLGYAHSNYERFNADQLTPTVSFGMNDGADWLQVRGYLVKFSDPVPVKNPVISDAVEDTVAVEAKLTHWLAPDNLLKLDNIKVGGLLGERMFGVDMDGASVYNLADLQRGSASAGAEWRIGEHANLMLFSGHEWYRDIDKKDNYGGSSLYLALSSKW